MISLYNLIHPSFERPKEWIIGSYNLIEENVSIGEEN